MTYFAQHISISINRSATHVYDFVANPENLPKWAAGVSESIRKVGNDWIADSPMGTIKIKFAETNTFGVLDHDVTLPSGVTFDNPMRVIPNNEGSEFVFTLYRRPEMSDEEFKKDAEMIEKDLKKLKTILEK